MSNYGEVLASDDHGPGEWRCMVLGCPIFGTWWTTRWPGDALNDHYTDKHQT